MVEGFKNIGDGVERPGKSCSFDSVEDKSEKIRSVEEEYGRENVAERLEEFVEQLKAYDLKKLMKEIDKLNKRREENKKLEIYLVGGCIKDIGSKNEREFNDIDVVIRHAELEDLFVGDGSGLLEKCGKVKDKTMKKTKKKDVEEKEASSYGSFQLTLTRHKGADKVECVDVARPRKEDPATGKSKDDPNLSIIFDLKRRLSTKDTVGVNIKTGKIIEGEEGSLDDVASGVVRATGEDMDMIETRLKADPIRAILLAKMACEDGAYLDKETRVAIGKVFEESEPLSTIGHEEKFKERDDQIRQAFKIPEHEKLPDILKISWNERKNTATTKTSRDRIGQVFLGAMKENPRKFMEVLDSVGGLKLLLPEIKMLEKNEYGEVLESLDKLPSDSSMELKFAVLLSKIKEEDISRTVAERFKFNKKLFYNKGTLSLLQRRKINELTEIQISDLISDDNKSTHGYNRFIDDLIEFGKALGETEGNIRKFINRVRIVRSRMEEEPLINVLILKKLFKRKRHWPDGFDGGNMSGLVRSAQLRGEIGTEEDAWKFIVRKVKDMILISEQRDSSTFSAEDVFSKRHYEGLKNKGLL